MESVNRTYNDDMHHWGRLFTWIALGLILMVPLCYCLTAGVMPLWSKLPECLMFILGYLAIGLVEALSYAPLLGTGGQYLTFITGNISNLKLPCALNSQSIAQVKDGTEEKEIVTTISIAVCSIVTTIVIVLGLIPLAIFQDKIVNALLPISPYVVPAIFGGLTCVLASRYLKIAAVPFVLCILLCVIGNVAGMGAAFNQGTMILVGMAVSAVTTTILYRRGNL
ncbi:MAG TPA: hypothetical protein PKW49_14380 [Paludibacteraceae bacterium]|nr:hypothetical protein [Paludibacteraceae bacterium]HOU69738.1 hypothetical protein [Paludibacteraceae bacterium]